MRNIESVLRMLATAEAEARKWAFKVQSLQNERDAIIRNIMEQVDD